MQQFEIQRVIVVANRAWLSIDNLAELKALKTLSGEPLEFSLAVTRRRYSDIEYLPLPSHKAQCVKAEAQIIFESRWEYLRLVVAHDPQAASERTSARDLMIKQLKDVAEQWPGKLDEQDSGKRYRYRKHLDGGARARC
jgi:hypothetical protein